MEHKAINGVYIDYYFICKRKLWYFANHIKMEEKSDVVYLGKLIDENSYKRHKKHILVDGIINIDFIDGFNVVHEVKKSDKLEEAAIWQVKYYLYYLKKKGIDDIRGMIDYPKLRKREIVILEDGDEEKLEAIIEDIYKIISMEKPPEVEKKAFCKTCSYYELCFI